MKRLLDALQRASWRSGVVIPERWVHRVDEQGTHTITLTLHANEVEWAPPAPARPLTWGMTTGHLLPERLLPERPGDRKG